MKKIFTLIFTLSAIAIIGFVNFEPEITSAISTSTSATVSLTVDSEISITLGTSTIALAPNLGSTQDTAIGSTTITVITSDSAGYTENIKYDGPLTNGTNSFTDFSTATSPQVWTDDIGGTDNYIFGFSVYGDNENSAFTVANANCGTAGLTSLNGATALYYGLSTTATTTAVSNNSTAGDVLTLCLAAEQGSNASAPSGSYSSTITITAATN